MQSYGPSVYHSLSGLQRSGDPGTVRLCRRPRTVLRAASRARRAASLTAPPSRPAQHGRSVHWDGFKAPPGRAISSFYWSEPLPSRQVSAPPASAERGRAADRPTVPQSRSQKVLANAGKAVEKHPLTRASDQSRIRRSVEADFQKPQQQQPTQRRQQQRQTAPPAQASAGGGAVGAGLRPPALDMGVGGAVAHHLAAAGNAAACGEVSVHAMEVCLQFSGASPRHALCVPGAPPRA